MLKQLLCEMGMQKEVKSESRWLLAKDDLKRTGTSMIEQKDEDVVERRP